MSISVATGRKIFPLWRFQNVKGPEQIVRDQFVKRVAHREDEVLMKFDRCQLR